MIGHGGRRTNGAHKGVTTVFAACPMGGNMRFSDLRVPLRGAHTFAACLLGTFAVMATLWAAPAWGAPVTILGYSPADGTVYQNTLPTVSVVATDPADPAGNFLEGEFSFWVTTPTGSTMSGPYIVRATNGVMTCTPTMVPDGNVSVQVRVKNVFYPQTVATKSWPIVYQQAPRFGSTSGSTPTSGSVAMSTTTTFSVALYDNGFATAGQLAIDGSDVPTLMRRYSSSINSVQNYLDTPNPQLRDGLAHTISARATDAAGNAAIDSWVFYANDKLDFASSGIANGMTITTPNPTWSFMARSARSQPAIGIGFVAPGTTFTQSAKTYSEPANGYRRLDITGTPSPYLPDGEVKVVASLDSFYAARTETFTVNVAVAPTIYHLRPAASMLVTDTTPVLVARATDNADVAPSSRFTVDGVEVASQARRITNGRFEATAQVVTPLSAEQTHTVAVTFTDAAGNATTQSYQFRVAGGDGMAHYNARTDCTVCHTSPTTVHTGYVMRGGDRIVYARNYTCNGCHASFPFHNPAGTNPSFVAADLANPATYKSTSNGCSCHDSASSNYGTPDNGVYALPAHAVGANGTRCRSCHERINVINDQGDYPNGRGTTMDLLAETPRHETTSVLTKCSACHKSDLTAEHAGRLDAAGVEISCLTCHRSTDPAVQQAVASGDTACGSCHTSMSAHSSLHVSITNSGCFGSGCHDASKNLQTVHDSVAGPDSENPEFATSCELCHENPAVNTSTSGTRCTGACHDGVTHESRLSGHAFSSAQSMACATCHGSSIEEIHDAYNDLTHCGWCHDDPANWSKAAECISCHPADPHPAAIHTTSGGCVTPGCHPVTVTAIHAEVGCDVCHGAGATPSLVCANCHASDAHTAAHQSTETCNECHAVRDLISIHGRDCTVCHPGPADAGWDGTCVSCHASRHTGMEFDHNSMNHNFTAETNCWACHAEQSPDWQCSQCHQVADRVAPVTRCDARATYAGSATVGLTSTDSGGSGILSVSYRLDGGPVTNGTSVTVSASSEPTTHTLEFWATDRARNGENPQTTSFVVFPAEFVAPVTTSDALAVYSELSTITLSATDSGGSGVAGTYYRVDGGPVAAGVNVKVDPRKLAAGTHVLQFWSIDYSGNVEAPKSATFVVRQVGTGLIYLAWDDPPEGSWANATVTSPDGSFVYQASSDAWVFPGWFEVRVPVSVTPYVITVEWFDPDYGGGGITNASAVVDLPGKTVFVNY